MPTQRTFVIAEAGVNHNGDLQLARTLARVAAEAGADAVKYQSFVPELLVSADAPKADYQKATTDAAESQLAMLRKLALSNEAHRELQAYCRELGIEFLSSPFDRTSLQLLTGVLSLKRLKLGSGELTNGPMLLAVARSGCELILSTGMSTLDEVAEALSVLAYGYLNAKGLPTAASLQTAVESSEGQAALLAHVTLLHCTTEYPAPFDEVNLQAMATLRETFGLPVGFSDHTPGFAIPLAAVAMGATVIEKHITLDKSLPGPDHQASLEPDELRAMIRGIREVEAALGSKTKAPTSSEVKNAAVARKSLIAAAPIRQGQLLTEANLGVKRPGTGISPMRYWDHLGKPAKRNYRADELID